MLGDYGGRARTWTVRSDSQCMLVPVFVFGDYYLSQ
jgi:hypothetical protein